VSWYETTDLRFIQKNLADGDYVVLIHAVDAENNLSDVFVAGCTVNVGTGPGYDFETALELNESYNTYDAVVGKLGQKTDYYTFTYGKAADIVFAVSDMYVFQDGGAANVKISIYDETYTEIFSTTVSTDQGAYLHHHVFEAGTYYAAVTSLNQNVSVGYAISTYRFATSVKSNLQNNGTSQIVAWDSAKGTVGYMANDGFYAPEWKGVWEWGSADASQWKVAGVGKFAGSSVDHDGILLYNKGSNTLAAWTNLSDGSYGYQSLCWVGNNVEVRGLTNQDNNGLDDVLVTDKNGSFGVIIDGMTYHDIWHSESAESNPWTLIGAGNFGGEQDSLLVYNKLEGAYYLWDNKDTSFAAWQWDSKPVA